MANRFIIKIHGEMVRQGLENLSNEIPLVGRQRIYQRMLRVKTRMSQPAPKPSYPIPWDSERQKRAFFASNGFRNGIPYRRNGATEKGWTLGQIEDGYRLANETPAAFFVYGDLFQRKSQSNIHAGRWPLTKVVAFEELNALPQELQADIEAAKKRSGL
jgi:hypothetical protein